MEGRETELRPPGHLSFPDTPEGGRKRGTARGDGGPEQTSPPCGRVTCRVESLHTWSPILARAGTRGLQSSREPRLRGVRLAHAGPRVCLHVSSGFSSGCSLSQAGRQESSIRHPLIEHPPSTTRLGSGCLEHGSKQHMTDPIPWSCVPLEERDLTLPPPRRCRINLCGAQHYEAWKPSREMRGKGCFILGRRCPGVRDA